MTAVPQDTTRYDWTPDMQLSSVGSSLEHEKQGLCRCFSQEAKPVEPAPETLPGHAETVQCMVGVEISAETARDEDLAAGNSNWFPNIVVAECHLLPTRTLLTGCARHARLLLLFGRRVRTLPVSAPQQSGWQGHLLLDPCFMVRGLQLIQACSSGTEARMHQELSIACW